MEDEWEELAAVIEAARAAWAAGAAEMEEEEEEAPAYDIIGDYKIGPTGDYEEEEEVEEYRDAEFFQWVPEKEPSRLNPLAPVFHSTTTQ